MTAKTAISSIDEPELSAAQAEKVLHMQKEILELVALGHDYQLILDQLCKTAEAMLPATMASIMLFDTDRASLTVKAAPSMPESAIKDLNGLVPGNQTGSCASAVYHNTPQFVCNVDSDERWANLRDVAKKYGIGSCWSMPIRDIDGQSFGSFALTSFQYREPSEFHKYLLSAGASLSSIILNRQEELQQLEYSAHHDALTDLPNRPYFSLRMGHAIERARRSGKKLALLFMDLDNFKAINDTQGHDTGDRVLKVASNAMKSCIRTTDTLARLGGDEFVLLIEDVDDEYELRHIAEKLLKAFTTAIKVDGKKYTLTTSMGISIYPEDGETADLLLQNADTAMYEAKAKGRNKFIYYEPRLTARVQKRVELEAELRLAIQADDFVVHYQPVYAVDSGKLQAVEVLVRWQHPEKGLIQPDDFIPLAEEIGLIKDLGYLVTRKACLQCIDWWNAGLPRFILAVNVSVNQLEHGCNNILKQLFEESGFPADHLEMEVTETLIMQPDGIAVAELEKMRKAGVHLSLDDFGTGQSSLSQLKNLPIGKLKIDRSFVMNIPDDKDDEVIARTIICMGHSLGLTVVAEGVETEAQKQFLQREKCDLMQGYLLSRPVPADEFRLILERESNP